MYKGKGWPVDGVWVGLLGAKGPVVSQIPTPSGVPLPPPRCWWQSQLTPTYFCCGYLKDRLEGREVVVVGAVLSHLLLLYVN